MRALIRPPHSDSLAWSSQSRWLHSPCPQAIWRIALVENTLFSSPKFLVGLHRPPWPLFHGSTPRFPRLHCYVEAIACCQLLPEFSSATILHSISTTHRFP